MVNGVLCCAIISAAMITLAVIALVASFSESAFRLNPKAAATEVGGSL